MPFRRSARVTLLRGESKHNRLAAPRRLALAACALGLTLPACSKTPLPPEGAYAAELVRLEGPPTLPPGTRLRVVVANAGLASAGEAPIPTLELLASRVSAANADIAVVFEFPFAADELEVTEAGDSVPYDAAEDFAVNADRYYRVGWVGHGRTDGLGRLARGPLIVAESPLAAPTMSDAVLASTVTFEGGAMPVLLGPGSDNALRIDNDPAACATDDPRTVRADDGALCLTPPVGWSVVRAGTGAVDGAVGDALRVELHRDAPLAPSPPNP